MTALLTSLLAELRRRALGISPDEIRYTFEDVRNELRATRAELKAELDALRREVEALSPREDRVKGPERPVPEA